MKSKRKSFLGALFLFLVFVLFWTKGTVSLDPDFGYRLRTGGLVLTQGIPRTDPYSYTMPSFPYVEHAWLTGLSWALLYPTIGEVGLAAISTALALSALIFSVCRAKIDLTSKEFSFLVRPGGRDLWYFGSFPFLLAIAVVLSFSGVRAQVVSWLAMSILLLVSLNSSIWRRWRKLLPVFFLLWTNLHGSFAAGIIVLFFVVLVRAFRKKKLEAVDLIIALLSLMGTFINPYGIGAWREVWLSVSDTSLRWKISEWVPAIFMADLSMAALITLSAVLILRYRKKFYLEELGLYFAFLLQALSSRRHLPLWVIVVLPMIIKALGYLYQETKEIKKAVPRYKKVLAYAWIGSFAILIFQSTLSLRGAFLLSETRFYPKDAVSFLRENMPKGQMFSEYGWGGYLIWRLPEKRVFIDGRMPSWRWGQNPPGETGAAFDDYNSLLQGEIDYKLVFNKYGVDTVLWPVSGPPTFYDILQNKVDEFLVRFGKEKSDFIFLEQLSKDGWKKVYGDSVSLIYKKPG